MCGIAVAIDWPEAESVVGRLIQGILHRGDVSDPIFSPRPNTAMATRRLRIVDADRAVQPQFSFDGQLAVSFNGEIYNHLALRQELETARRFRSDTESDTEVLANALQVWGYRGACSGSSACMPSSPSTSTTGEFLAARDPFGVKPLYVMQSGDRLSCSARRCARCSTPSRAATSCCCRRAMRCRPRPACRFKSPVYPRARYAHRKQRQGARRHSVGGGARRLPPDLPVATLFSGGIDSTLIAHYTRQFRPEAPGYFVGSVHAPDFRYAADYAAQTGFDLRIVPFDADSDEVFAAIDHVVEVTESFEPNLVRGAICSLMAAQRMHEDGFRVALCGEGADELFCGYAPLELAFGERQRECRRPCATNAWI